MKLWGKLTFVYSIALCVAALLLCFVQAAYAYDADNDTDTEKPLTWDKWLYYDRGDHVCVCGYTGVDGKITIPAEINGKPVTEISPHDTGTFEDPQYKFFEDYNENTSEVVVSEGVLSVNPYTFINNLRLKTIALPKSLKCIGNSAFAYCENLTSVIVPENVKSIGKEAFLQTRLTEIYLPEGLEFIGAYAFTAAPLTHIDIPNTVTYIGGQAFYSTKLEEIILPSSLTKLEERLLSGCIRLKRAYISEGTVSIGTLIFETCPNLEEVYFPSTLREANNIFNHNRNLKNIYFAANEEECRMRFGNNIMDKLKGGGQLEEPGSEYYNSVKITYGTPVPLAEPLPYPKEPLKLDIGTVILIAASIICFILTVIFLTLFIREKKQTLAARAEEKKREEEGFHPEVLGTWECKKCKTVNSPIGSYCYKCGRKR